MAAQIDSPLLPRYQRPLTFGGILDETFRLYRGWWARLAAITALSYVPALVGFVLWGGATAVAAVAAIGNAAALRNNDGALGVVFASIGGGLTAIIALLAVGTLVGEAAVSALTGRLVRGDEPSVRQVYGMAIQRFLPLLGFSIVAVVAIFLLAMLAVVLLVVGAFGLLSGLVALIGLIVWINRSEGERPPWLKWLIILATPFGLPIYYGTCWSLAMQAIVLEGCGPLEGMRRSYELVDGQWFKVFGVWLVVGIVVSILEGIPSAVVVLVGSLLGLGSNLGGSLAGSILQLAAGAARLLGWVLFSAVPFVSATLLFVDLRNRREVAGLADRLGQLELV